MDMQSYIILSRFHPAAYQSPAELRDLAHQVKQKVREECTGVEWVDSYATLGNYDVVDIVRAADIREVERAAMIIRIHGHATTTTLPANPWKTFLSNL